MAIDNTEWDGPAAMSRAAASDDPAAAYAAICAGRREGDPAVQSTWALPHHRESGMGPNANGIRACEAVMGGARGGVEGLTNREAAQRHIDAHMAEIQAAMGEEASAEAHDHETHADKLITLNVANETIQTLSIAQRRLGLRIVPYNTVALHPAYGALLFEPGAFGTVDPKLVRLRMDHEDPPTGLGEKFSDLADAPYMEFLVSKTERGNDQLTLAADGVSRGASVGYSEVAGKPKVRRIDGRNVTVYPPGSVVLHEVSTTWQPTFAEAGVMYVLHKEEKGTAPMAEAQEAPVSGAVDTAPIVAAIQQGFAEGKSFTKIEEAVDKMLGIVDQFKELQRSQFNVPPGDPRKPKLHDWVEVTLRRMRGEQIPPTRLRELALDDVVTTEQPGLVPNQLVPDYDDLIDQNRPFLNSTREVVPPDTGTSMLLPIITTRAVAGTQAGSAEKGVLTTTATKVGTGTFPYVAVFGGADISIQMIQRAGRSFFDLLTGDMGEAYALDCEAKAIAALLAGYTDSASVAHAPVSGGLMDPTDPMFGAAWVTSILASKRAPTHIWLSAVAVGAFIDAKAPLTNAPLYSSLAASFTAAGGAGGTLSGLTPIYVPALDTAGVDVIIGPSRGFVWAEDPALNLQADVPSNAGRDIALVGGIFPAPRYADAFTTYTVAS
jgi:phage head maturation protease